MITGTCHCGAVRYEFRHSPSRTTSCNCSICRRLGTLWIYAPIADVTIDGPTRGYAHGDKNLAIHHCPTCGCVTHWENLHPEKPDAYMAVNLRLADPNVIASVPVRRFDGAETWTFLD
ncbi:GFA family protein [Yoonia sp. BS5-3]|uniref:GFA family protein n=1 Tax=Yoonia phaeophyticola TaxID=3137369 RepID=A0ABZ2V485_9RHOB